MKKISVGDMIPLFILPDQHGRMINIADFIGQKNLVIFFYPKDFTPGCTAEVCSFRDHYEEFLRYDAEVFGISSDDVQRHQRFSENYNLPFYLLSDKNQQVRKLFGVPGNLFGLMPGRVTFIVDRKGVVRHTFNSQFNISKHISEALKILAALENEK